MQRRELLRMGAGVATATTIGLAGCLGGGCGTPDGDISGALPDSSDYEQVNNDTDFGDVKNVEDSTGAGYSKDDEPYVFYVFEFKDSNAAKSVGQGLAKENSQSDNKDSTSGTIVADKYVYLGIGPDKSAVKTFMGASPPLEGCVEDNINFG